MDDLQARLAQCFSAVFPNLSSEEVVGASFESIDAWDSVASITLLTLIEEEFEITVHPEDIEEINSFSRILTYLQKAKG